MENVTYVVVAIALVIMLAMAIAIGLVIIIVINKSRNPPPISLEKAIDQQIDVINRLMNWDPGLQNFIRAAIQEGATHMQYNPQDDTIALTGEMTIAFFRMHEGKYEKRFLFLHDRTFSIGAKWELGWRKCDELPRDAIPVPETE